MKQREKRDYASSMTHLSDASIDRHDIGDSSDTDVNDESGYYQRQRDEIVSTIDDTNENESPGICLVFSDPEYVADDYFVSSWRRDLSSKYRDIGINLSNDEFNTILSFWKRKVDSFKSKMNELHDKYPMLSFFSVTDVRFLFDCIVEYDVYNEYKLETLLIIVNKLCVVPSISRYYRHDINSVVTKEWIPYLQSRGHLNDFNNSSKRIKDEYLFETIGNALTKSFDVKLVKYDSMYKLPIADTCNFADFASSKPHLLYVFFKIIISLL